MSHSNDNNKKKFSFNVDLKNPSEFTKVTIFDSNDRVQASAYNRTSTQLPRGLYTVRAEMDGHMEEKVVRHAGDSNIQIDTPGRFSSALLSGFRTSHEYYTDPAVNWSKTNTAKSVAPDKYDNGGIFIFLRYATGDIFKKLFTGNSIGALFSLEDHRGNRVCTFTPGFIKEDLESGWLAFSTDVEPGLYFIRYSGSVPRMIPLYIYQGWQTQVFL
ncbi:MAG: hypothetical protein GY757_49670, partial [bacterium]|nr:hypothetical protein [bacterium]